MALRTQVTHTVKSIEDFKTKLLYWSQYSNTIIWLDSNNHKDTYTTYDAILALDAHTELTTSYKDAFDALQDYQTKTKDWIFGYLTYDLKNGIENLHSNNYDGLNFPDLHFFQPKKLFLIKGNTIKIAYLKATETDIENDFKAISSFEVQNKTTDTTIKIRLRLTKDKYLENVTQMLQHIQHGDIYEANYCQEFYAETKINPLESFQKLNAISKPPFATFLKHNSNYLLSATPERYIKKDGQTIISQPIKGTAKRSEDKDIDAQLAKELAINEKERSENIMIVDLVRNDLSKTAAKGSVKVKELCKVYSFLQVHQMISTITSELKKDIHPVEVLKTTFPMGSMTGAPKISALQIIEDLEVTKRGLYSGSVGYFTPEGDFDFNVIIRSILYNATKEYVSFSVGSAITAKSNPINEYEECLIKAKAMREVLEG